MNSYLEQKSIASLLLNSSGDSFGVRNKKIISNNLDTGASSQLCITLPVILVKGILNADNWVVLDET